MVEWWSANEVLVSSGMASESGSGVSGQLLQVIWALCCVTVHSLGATCVM